jgi:type I restriction enzyme S subunit
MEIEKNANNDHIPPGYKKTEVGVIPEDWEVKRLKSFLVQLPSYGINAPAVPFSDRLPKYLRITDISESGDYVNSNKVSVDQPNSEEYLLRKGDIVLARTGASVGKSYLYKEKDGELVFAGFLIKVTPDKKKLIPEYLRAFLDTKLYWDWVQVHSMRSGQPGINGTEYSELPIPLPPTKTEQTAIAKVLSDIDALLRRTGELIEKKRAVKQGAMQELLSGRRRLDGFEEKWKFRRVDEICPLQRGFDLPTSKIRKGPFPIVYSNGIINYHQESQVKAPGVVTGRSGTLGKVTFVEKDFWPHNTTLWVTDFRGNDPRFIFYLLQFLKLERFGTGSGVPTLNRNDVHNYEILFPLELAEQQAIAQILSNMDAEIQTLEQKQAKYRALKQGMMQELLTGKTRLV